jgi:hypothetical protein
VICRGILANSVTSSSLLPKGIEVMLSFLFRFQAKHLRYVPPIRPPVTFNTPKGFVMLRRCENSFSPFSFHYFHRSRRQEQASMFK